MHKAIKFILAQSIRLFAIQVAIETLNRHSFPGNKSLDYSGMEGYCCLEVNGYCFCGMDGHDLRKMEAAVFRELGQSYFSITAGSFGNADRAKCTCTKFPWYYIFSVSYLCWLLSGRSGTIFSFPVYPVVRKRIVPFAGSTAR